MPRRNLEPFVAIGKRARDALSAANVDGVWEWDHRRRVAVYDRGAAHHLAGDAELAERTLPAETAMAMIHPEDMPWLREQTVRAVQEGKVILAEYRVFTADGDMRWILSRGRTERSEGVPLVTRGIIIDITQTREAGRGYVIATSDPHATTIEQVADHAIALKRLLGTQEASPLSLLVDMLLLQTGRELGREHAMIDMTLLQ